MTPLERTTCKNIIHDWFHSPEGRRLGRLVTAERSKGKDGNVDARLNEIAGVFRRAMTELYMQPEPKQL
jgi:hypothetical protein